MEKEIDFMNDCHSAVKCTMAFAAMELKAYLSQSIKDCNIAFSDTASDGDFFIKLKVIDETDRDDRYSIEPMENGIKIVGNSQVGLLNC